MGRTDVAEVEGGRYVDFSLPGVSMYQDTSGYVRIRQDTSGYVSIPMWRKLKGADILISLSLVSSLGGATSGACFGLKAPAGLKELHTSAYVSIRQQT